MTFSNAWGQSWGAADSGSTLTVFVDSYQVEEEDIFMEMEDDMIDVYLEEDTDEIELDVDIEADILEETSVDYGDDEL